jgi:hypothetical protein
VSDVAQVVVDLEVRDQDAARLAESILRWLAEARIIDPDLTDCGLSGAAYPPGPNAGAVLAPTASGDGAFMSLRTNGLLIRVGRNVHDAGANGIELHCDPCGGDFTPDDSYHREVSAWFGGNDHATFACPNCGAAKLLNEWRGPCPCGFGNLAFEFWNWPPLSEEFLAAMNRQLGHRTRVVWRHV